MTLNHQHRNPIGAALYELVADLAEANGDITQFSAPREQGAYEASRSAFRNDAFAGDVPAGMAALDEATVSYANAMFHHGIELGMVFARFVQQVQATCPERICDDCFGALRDRGDDRLICGRCGGAGVIAEALGSSPAQPDRR